MKLRKIISFKQHEKYMFDFINDKALVPDASALIKNLLRAYIEQVNNKNTAGNMQFEDIINSQSPQMYENMVQNLKNQYSSTQNVKKEPEKVTIDENTVEHEEKYEKTLQVHNPTEDIAPTKSFEDETNDDMLRGLDL